MLVDVTPLDPPAVVTGNVYWSLLLDGEGEHVAVTGYMYWPLLLDGEGEYAVDVAERVGEGICGVSGKSAATSFKVGDLCEGRSL